MIELTEYAKAVLRDNPEKVRLLRDRIAICNTIRSRDLTIISINEMYVLLNVGGEGSCHDS